MTGAELSMMRNAPPVELPEKYYLDYFESLLGFVEEKCGSLLSRREKNFYRRFRGLPEEARCLFVRLTNRKGCYFRLGKLSYTEVPDPEATAVLLCERKFLISLSPRHATDISEIMCLFPKAELLALLKQLDADWLKGRRTLKKPDLVAQAADHFNGGQLISIIRRQETVVRVCCEAEVEMLRFLYFGDINSDMTQFVVRDMGIVKTETFDESKLRPYFSTRREAEDKLRISKAYRDFKVMRDEQLAPADSIYEWFVAQAIARAQFCEPAWPLFDKLALRLGKLLEQQKHPDFALRVYQHTQKPPARERCVRLMHKLGLKDDALGLCDAIIGDPQNAEEHYFAQDFRDRIRRKKRTKRTTDFLKNSDCIELEEDRRHYVEGGVLEYYQRLGYQGIHAENYLWRSFFGLLFWDIIFDEDCEALHHPMQIAPTDFYTPKFLTKRKPQLQERLKVLDHPDRFYNIIQHHYETKVGMSNPLVGWHESILPLVAQCYESLEGEQVRRVLLEMARDLKENTKGFPDLFVWRDSTYHFIEVKSPNDHLSAQQLHWLTFFRKLDIRAEVIRVCWKSD